VEHNTNLILEIRFDKISAKGKLNVYGLTLKSHSFRCSPMAQMDSKGGPSTPVREKCRCVMMPSPGKDEKLQVTLEGWDTR